MGKTKKKNNTVDCPYSWEQCLDDCFDKNDENFSKMMNIISEQKKLFGIEKIHGNEVHHIVPKAFYKKNKYNIDNSESNLVSLETRYHFQVHYYAYLCAKPSIKRSMTYAFQMMYNKYKKIISEDDLISASVLYENFKNSKPLPKKYQKKYTDEERTKLTAERNKKMWSEKRNMLIQNMRKPHNITSDYKLLSKEKIDIVNRLLSITNNEIASPNNIRKFIHFLDKNATMNLGRYNFQYKNIRGVNLIFCKELDFCATKKEWADIFAVSERTIQDCKNKGTKLFQVYTFEDFGISHCDIFEVVMYLQKDPTVLDRLKEVLEEMYKINEI